LDIYNHTMSVAGVIYQTSKNIVNVDLYSFYIFNDIDITEIANILVSESSWVKPVTTKIVHGMFINAIRRNQKLCKYAIQIENSSKLLRIIPSYTLSNRTKRFLKHILSRDWDLDEDILVAHDTKSDDDNWDDTKSTFVCTPLIPSNPPVIDNYQRSDPYQTLSDEAKSNIIKLIDLGYITDGNFSIQSDRVLLLHPVAWAYGDMIINRNKVRVTPKDKVVNHTRLSEYESMLAHSSITYTD
jgi:hypothetical protein